MILVKFKNRFKPEIMIFLFPFPICFNICISMYMYSPLEARFIFIYISVSNCLHSGIQLNISYKSMEEVTSKRRLHRVCMSRRIVISFNSFFHRSTFVKVMCHLAPAVILNHSSVKPGLRDHPSCQTRRMV
jgi:hypothetical protein